MDWTGSSQQRREQGNCPASPIDGHDAIPPWERDHSATRPARKPLRYLIPAHTGCHVKKMTGASWRLHSTEADVEFPAYVRAEGKLIVFSRQGWLLRVHRAFIIDRKRGVVPIRRRR